MSDYLTYIKDSEKQKYQHILSEVEGSGNRVRALRELKGISQSRLADESGSTTRQHIYKIEQSKNISKETATKLASVLETSPEYLLCLTDDPFGSEFQKEKISEYVSIMQDKIISLSADLQKIKDLLN